MLKIPRTETVDSEGILERIGTKSKLILTSRKRQLKFLGRMIRKDSIENLTLAGHK